MRPLLAWFRAHRIITWSLRVVLVLWGVHLWMNWAAEREWRQYCDEARRRGVKLTLAEFEPPEVPEAENFAMLPMFKAAYAAPIESVIDPFELPGGKTKSAQPKASDPIKGTPIDWAVWQQYFKKSGLIADESDDSVADVLRALDHYRPTVNEWREWKHRPQSRFAVDWKSDSAAGRIPAFGILQSATTYFGLRMRAHIAQHDSAAALEDFLDAFHAYRALRAEPQLVPGLVRVAVLGVVGARVGGGLTEHAWVGEDLRTIDAELAGVRVWDEYRVAISCERASLISLQEKFATAGWWERANRFATIGSATPEPEGLLIGLSLAKRDIRDNQMRTNRYFDELLDRVTERGIDFDRVIPSGREHIVSYFEIRHYALFSISTSILSGVEERYLRAQTQLSQTRLAIALERHHLAHGAFPETLDELVPAFLDEPLLDPWSGKPMKYRRNKTDSFLLYSIGKDRKDDGGVINLSKTEYSQPDAIWLYAPP